MNPDTPLEPREELEVRLTAHLLGELTPDEAAALEAQIAGDSELAALHGRLRVAVDLLREASAIPDQPAPQTPLKLSNDRRERLTEHFKTAPRSTALQNTPPRRRDWKWLTSYGLAAAVIALIGGSFLVNGLFTQDRFTARVLIEVEPSAGGDEGFGDSSLVADAPQFLQSEFKAITGTATLDPVIDKLGLVQRWNLPNRDEAYQRLRDIVDVDNERGTDLFRITASSDDPKEAADIANTVAQTYAERRNELEKERINTAIATIDNTRRKQEERVEAARSKMQELIARNKVVDFLPLGSLGAQSPPAAEAMHRELDVQAKVADAKERLDALQDKDGDELISAAANVSKVLEQKKDLSSEEKARIAAFQQARDDYSLQLDILQKQVEEHEKAKLVTAMPKKPATILEPASSSSSSSSFGARLKSKLEDVVSLAAVATAPTSSAPAPAQDVEGRENTGSLAMSTPPAGYRAGTVPPGNTTVEAAPAVPPTLQPPIAAPATEPFFATASAPTTPGALPAPAKTSDLLTQLSTVADSPSPSARGFRAGDDAISEQAIDGLIKHRETATTTGGVQFGNAAIAGEPADTKRFEPPQLPQDFGGRAIANANGPVTAQPADPVAAFPITPTTPAEQPPDAQAAGGVGVASEETATALGFETRQSRRAIVPGSRPAAPDITGDFDTGVAAAPSSGFVDLNQPQPEMVEDRERDYLVGGAASRWHDGSASNFRNNFPIQDPRTRRSILSADKSTEGFDVSGVAAGTTPLSGIQVHDDGLDRGRTTPAGGGVPAENRHRFYAWAGESGKPATEWDTKWGRATELTKGIEESVNGRIWEKPGADSTDGDAIKLAKKEAERGEFESARKIASDVLAGDSASGDEAKKLLGRLGDAAWYKATGATAESAQGVNKQLQLGQNYFQLGDLEKARATFNEALATDPSNVDARRGLEQVERTAGDHFLAARDQTRIKVIREVEYEPETANKAADTPAQALADIAPEERAGELAALKQKVDGEEKDREKTDASTDAPGEKPAAPPPVPQPEVETRANPFSTFSLNVTDVSFKLTAASLEQGKLPDPASVRSEEFINAFDYRDPEPAAGAPLAFAFERARYPFAQNRDLLRLSVKTAAAGRQPGRALNLVVVLDNSGSMERADRVQIVREALRVLTAQLQPTDKLSVITFARTPTLWTDGVAGDKAAEATARVSEITPQGGTNIGAALELGYQTALRHYQVGNINRVVLMTDGAANLGDVNPDALKQKVELHRRQGIALDCFGVGWEGYDDNLLETLSRNGDGRYGFINSVEEAATEFAGQLAGALRVAASDVKVQVEFNPRRVSAYRQIGYAKHQLTKEQFRDNTVDAAEIGAAESGNALYAVEVNPRGAGDLATVRVRFKVPGTADYREHEWTVPFTGEVPSLEHASPTLRLAGVSSAFSERLVSSPFASEVSSDRLLAMLGGVPAFYGADSRPQKLEWMIRQAANLSGR